MNSELLLNKIIELSQLFDEFNKSSFSKNYKGLGINEVHAIDYIGDTKNPNVTKITEFLKITKGGVTKITKKLMDKSYIESYQIEGNKKEKYFKLTEEGRKIFLKHKLIHEESVNRDKLIFDKFDDYENKIISRFLNELIDDYKEKLSNL